MLQVRRDRRDEAASELVDVGRYIVVAQYRQLLTSLSRGLTPELDILGRRVIIGRWCDSCLRSGQHGGQRDHDCRDPT